MEATVVESPESGPKRRETIPSPATGYNVLAADLLQGCPFCVKYDYIQSHLANATYSGDAIGRNKGPDGRDACHKAHNHY